MSDASSSTGTPLPPQTLDLKAAFELAPIGVTITRLGVTEYCNPAYLVMFGYDGHEAEIYGKSMLMMVAPSHREQILARIRRRQQGDREDASYELNGLRRDGTEFPFMVVTRSVVTDGGPATLAFFLDMTEQRRAQEGLRQANDRLVALFRASPVPTMSLDTEGRVLTWNPAAEKVFGWTAAEAVGRINPIVGEEHLPGFLRNMAQVLDEGGLNGREARRVRKDGTPVDVVIHAAALRDAQGHAEGTMMLFVDVTASKQTQEALRRSEEQLRQAQKMEAVGRLAGGVAHDFNNLLTALCGFTELLSDELGSSHPSMRHLDQIRAATHRATTLTSQLLAFSRRQVLNPEVLDVNTVVSHLDGMMRRLIGAHIEFTVKTGAAGVRVRADAGQLEQVVVNLVLNARDAMEGGGVLTVSTEQVELDDRLSRDRFPVPAGRYCVIRVHDTGTGMDAGTMDRLFEPFFTTKARGKGTGLGLSTAYGIVHQSGGHIHVESRLGEGSTFSVFLPPAHAPAAGSGWVLLVEDDATVRLLAREYLHRSGYSVLEAADGEQGLRILEDHAHQVRLLLTDVVMPRISGPELAERAWAIAPSLPVLFVSGYTERTAFPPAAHGGAVAFLAKPFTRECFLRKVEEVLQSAAHPAPAPA